ncbi:hypothetical protein HDU76_004324 [Blyttiomyces sp. JEL0837]|nr:hypothetical protein HDU76_004324 [Blyttiomyces sp. JEL0837]
MPFNTEASQPEPPRGVVTSSNQSTASGLAQKPTKTTESKKNVVDDQPSGRKRMQVFVKNLTGKTLAVTMTAISTVSDLKRFLEIKTGVPVERQRLIYTRFNDLGDFETLVSYGIEHECLIMMALRVEVSLYMRETAVVLQDLKQPVKLFLRRLYTQRNETFAVTDSFMVTRGHSVKDLKALYSNHSGVPAGRLRFFYVAIMMEDELTLAHYGIRHDCLVNVMCR